MDHLFAGALKVNVALEILKRPPHEARAIMILVYSSDNVSGDGEPWIITRPLSRMGHGSHFRETVARLVREGQIDREGTTLKVYASRLVAPATVAQATGIVGMATPIVAPPTAIVGIATAPLRTRASEDRGKRGERFKTPTVSKAEPLPLLPDMTEEQLSKVRTVPQKFWEFYRAYYHAHYGDEPRPLSKGMKPCSQGTWKDISKLCRETDLPRMVKALMAYFDKPPYAAREGRRDLGRYVRYFDQLGNTREGGEDIQKVLARDARVMALLDRIQPRLEEGNGHALLK